MQLRPLRLAALVVVLPLSLACGGDSDDATPTPVPPSETRSRPAVTASPTPAPTTTPAPTAEPTREPWLQQSFVPVDRTRPLETRGSYLVDLETMEVWYLGRGGAWSPDGRVMASGYCCLGDGRGVDIVQVPSGVTLNVPVAGDVTTAVWSQDSQGLAIVAVTPGVSWPESERALFLLNQDGSGLRKVATIVAERPWFELHWLDGESVLAVQESLGDFTAPPVYTYFRIDLAAGNITEVMPSDPPGPRDPRILTGEPSPDGRWVAYVDDGLHVWNAATGAVDLVDEAGRSPLWSPGGELLVFEAGGQDRLRLPSWRLYAVRTGVTEELPEVGLWAQWLPDGRLLHAGWWCDYDAATPGGIGGVQDVTVQSADGQDVQRLTNTPDVYETEVTASPEGDVAVFVPREPVRSLELVDLQSGDTETIVRGPADNQEPIYVGGWSPDGRYVQFSYGFAHGLCD